MAVLLIFSGENDVFLLSRGVATHFLFTGNCTKIKRWSGSGLVQTL
ncbi:MAG: hypothetical protein ACI95X_002644, partial [Paraglaciecola sp.]